MTATAQRKHLTIQRVFAPDAVQGSDLPPGICGRLQGIGMVYEVPDAYGTAWAIGCLDITKRSKVPAGKVGLFMAGSFGHEYGVRSHIGVVRSCETRGAEEWITAELFDTEDGRRVKEYLTAVIASGGATGLSIGCYVRKEELSRMANGDEVVRFTEVELEEFTVTPRPAVPGASVDAVRQNPDALWSMFDALLAVLPIDEIRTRLAARVVAPDAPTPAASIPATSGSDAPAEPTAEDAPALPDITEAARARALVALYLGVSYNG